MVWNIVLLLLEMVFASVNNMQTHGSICQINIKQKNFKSRLKSVAYNNVEQKIVELGK